MSGAEEHPVIFQSVPNDPDAAMGARRRHCLDGALETIEGVPFAVSDDLECLIVVVPADFTLSHFFLPPLRVTI